MLVESMALDEVERVEGIRHALEMVEAARLIGYTQSKDGWNALTRIERAVARRKTLVVLSDVPTPDEEAAVLRRLAKVDRIARRAAKAAAATRKG